MDGLKSSEMRVSNQTHKNSLFQFQTELWNFSKRTSCIFRRQHRINTGIVEYFYGASGTELSAIY